MDTCLSRREKLKKLEWDKAFILPFQCAKNTNLNIFSIESIEISSQKNYNKLLSSIEMEFIYSISSFCKGFIDL